MPRVRLTSDRGDPDWSSSIRIFDTHGQSRLAMGIFFDGIDVVHYA